MAARRAADLGVEDPPEVEVIREIAPNAQGLKVLTDCMIDKGYPYEYDETQDGVSIDTGLIDYEQHQLDTYICEMQYPVAQQYQVEWGQREWRTLYDHYVQEYIPCVTRLGYVPEPSPTFEVFYETVTRGGPPWSPETEILPQLRQDIDAGEYASLDQFHRDVCPDSPPLEALYGDDTQ